MNNINNISLSSNSLVGNLLKESERNSVDEYLDGLQGPSREDLDEMQAERDLENEELE